MTNPNTSSIPGMGAMTDTFDFMKNLWGSMSVPGLPGMKIPGMVMPTLSVEEIDKQIKDLKSVESWLTMNLTMLRGTIQALEVQSATITTIQSMSTSFATAMKPGTKPDETTKEAAKTERPGKPIFESPFTSQPAKKQEEPTEASAAQTDAAPPMEEAEKASTATSSGESA
ncbi:MAG: PhaM family polyhydroxyalkanoate granule multifunctional regulatory protein, partial [Burkholderiaceae bacterium]